MIREARQIGEVAFMLAWVGGGLFFFVRMRLLQVDYFSRYAGLVYYPFNIPFFFRPISPLAILQMFRLMFGRQADPSLESLRREIWTRWFQMGAWIFLFPIPFIIVLAILTSSGMFR